MYTSTESILTGNARRNKLVDAAAERRLNESLTLTAAQSFRGIQGLQRKDCPL